MIAARLARALLAGAMLLTATGIDAQPRQNTAQQTGPYTVTGMVLKVDVERATFVVSHDAIPGLMPAMTMSFDVPGKGALAGIEPGASVSFTLTIDERGGRASGVRTVRYESAEQDPVTARRLRLLRQITGGTVTPPVAIGRIVPDFTLTSQVRRSLSLAQLRGKVVVLNFIYTSCALPQFCLRITNHFGVLQRRFRSELGRELVLLTVTFDPARDTPERLAEYASQWDADPAAWHFLTGPAGDIRRVAGMFGVDFFPDEGLMSHSLHTAIIDRSGALVANIEGNQFTAAQLGDLVETTVRRQSR